MFDYVKCEIPLPDGWEPDELQTKDFDCFLDTIIIKADGTLERVGVRWFDEATEPRKKLEIIDFHGFLRFYGIEELRSKGAWHEYKAKFTDGKLVTLEVVKEDVP